MVDQDVGAAEAANAAPAAYNNPLAGENSSETRPSSFYRLPTTRNEAICTTRILSNHLTTSTIGVAVAGGQGGGAHSGCPSSSSSDYSYDFVPPTSSVALHQQLDQFYSPSSSLRTSRGGGTKKKKEEFFFNDTTKSYGSSHSKSSSDDSVSMKKPAAMPLGSVKFPPKHSGSSMGSETDFSASSVPHLLGFHLERREPFRSPSLSTTAMEASTTAPTTTASRSDPSWTASATALAAGYRPTGREGPPARSASLQPTSSSSTSGSQVEYCRHQQQQRLDEFQDRLVTRREPFRQAPSVSAAKSSDRLVMPPYQQRGQLLNESYEKEDQATEKDTYPSAVAPPKPSASYMKSLTWADEAVSVAASPRRLPTRTVSLQIVSPTSSSLTRNPYRHLVLDRLDDEDEKNHQGYPSHHHSSSLSQPLRRPSPTTPPNPFMMNRPRSIYTTTLDTTSLTRSQRSHSFAVTTNSTHHHNHMPDSFDSESKRQERILHEYSRLKESLSGRDSGTTTSSESGSSMSGSFLILDEYASQGWRKKSEKTSSSSSSSSSSSKANVSVRSSTTTSNRESSMLDEIEQLERKYDLEQVYDGDDDFEETRPEL